MLEEGLGRCNLHDLAVKNQGDAVRETARLEDVVRHQDHGGALFFVQSAHSVFNDANVVRIQVGGRLIQQQNIGADDHRAGQRHTLRLAAR